eukprot:508713-Lingulodinium_polyedra.AAC.1
MDLVTSLLFARGSSMAWHSQSWPGLLALLCSNDPQDTARCLELLRTDWEALQACEEKARHSLVLQNAVAMSPLKARPMVELCEKLSHDDPPMAPTDASAAARLSYDLFSGFGQSKVIEDANKEARDSETFNTKNKT